MKVVPIESGATVFVASGRARFSPQEGLALPMRSELDHLRRVLDSCDEAEVRRVVVLGSSDVAGLAETVDGRSVQAPRARYAEVKAALEDECVLRAEAGMPITSVRLAPVHGAGKSRTMDLVRLVRRRIVPLPSGGRHSIGFVLLDDAIRALTWLGQNAAPAVVAVGGGPTPLRDLLDQLAIAQGVQPRFVPVPIPKRGLRTVATLPMPSSLHWLVRLSLPKAVQMEVPIPISPLREVAARLVSAC